MLKILTWIARVFYNFTFHISEEFQQDTSGKIVACNHLSSIDALFIWIMLKGNCTVIGLESSVQNKNWFIRKLSKKFDSILIKDTPDILSTRKMLTALKQGKTLVIFPEGAITTTGWLMPLEKGTGFLAKKQNVCIYPVRLAGLLTSRFSKTRFNGMILPVSATMLDKINPENYQNADAVENITKDLEKVLA